MAKIRNRKSSSLVICCCTCKPTLNPRAKSSATESSPEKRKIPKNRLSKNFGAKETLYILHCSSYLGHILASKDLRLKSKVYGRQVVTCLNYKKIANCFCIRKLYLQFRFCWNATYMPLLRGLVSSYG